MGSISLTAGDYSEAAEVQLEVGDTATPFEHRSYGDELARCQRYYQVNSAGYGSNEGIGAAYSVNAMRGQFQSFPVTMRAAPSVSISNAEFYSGDWVADATVSAGDASPDGFNTNYTKTSAFSTRNAYPIQYGYTCDAEL